MCILENKLILLSFLKYILLDLLILTVTFPRCHIQTQNIRLLSLVKTDEAFKYSINCVTGIISYCWQTSKTETTRELLSIKQLVLWKEVIAV